LTTAAAKKKPLDGRGVGGAPSVGATVPNKGRVMAFTSSAEVVFSQVTDSMTLVADKGGSDLADATTAFALASSALSAPLGFGSPVRGQSQLSLSVGADSDAGGLKLGTKNTLGRATSDELRMAIIGRVRGLCAELLRLSAPQWCFIHLPGHGGGGA